MLKKTIPLFLLSGLVLGGCANNDPLPGNNETPMEGVQDRERNWTPNVNDEQRGGTNLDGIDDGRDVNDNGVRNGIINDETIIDEDIDLDRNGSNR